MVPKQSSFSGLHCSVVSNVTFITFVIRIFSFALNGDGIWPLGNEVMYKHLCFSCNQFKEIIHIYIYINIIVSIDMYIYIYIRITALQGRPPSLLRLGTNWLAKLGCLFGILGIGCSNFVCMIKGVQNGPLKIKVQVFLLNAAILLDEMINFGYSTKSMMNIFAHA